MSANAIEHEGPTGDRALFSGEQDYASLADRITGVVLGRFGRRWLVGVGIGLTLTMMMLVSMAWLIGRGVGVWGIDIPVAWGFAIINFVWWIGIAQAGTFVSAILVLMRQRWRNSINRFAEAMTLFAVANAGLFPLLHLGRIWKLYYLLPYPNRMQLWPQWRSPLEMDAFEVLVYGLVSLMFWYLGLLPDLATLRDTANRRWIKIAAGFACLGWRGSAMHWHRQQVVYILMAGLATPLVVCVHSIVSLDFAVAIVPGWHGTNFPPYFVAGAIYSGIAMALTIAIPLRSVFNMKDLITTRHLDLMGKAMLTTGLILAYGYVMEAFTEWYSGDPIEWWRLGNRTVPVFLAVLACNVVAAQTLWFKRIRTRPIPLFVVSVIIVVGMWLERYDIVVTSLRQGYLPSAWGHYTATFWDWSLLIGSVGFFILLFLIFVRFIPALSINELQHQLHETFGGPTRAGAGKAQTAPEVERPLQSTDAASGRGRLLGLMAEFETPELATEAARRLRESGYRRLNAYSPFPIEKMTEALGLRTTRLPIVMLIGAAVGGGCAWAMQWYSTVVAYPWNIGGRPDNSWPSYIPITFQFAVLGAATFGFLGVVIRNGFPRPFHPVMGTPGFERASRDRFFVSVHCADAKFDPAGTRAAMRELRSLSVQEVRS